MIHNKNKFDKFVKLLSIIGIFVSTISYSDTEFTSFREGDFTNNEYVYSSYSNSFSNDDLTLPVKVNNHALSLYENAIRIAKENAPYQIKDIQIDNINDEFAILKTIYVYMNMPDSIEDNLIVYASEKATNLVNSEEYLIIYL